MENAVYTTTMDFIYTYSINVFLALHYNGVYHAWIHNNMWLINFDLPLSLFRTIVNGSEKGPLPIV